MIKLKEHISQIKFSKPNFEYEWEEAERYPKLFPDKQTWLDSVKNGVEKNILEHQKINHLHGGMRY